MSLLRFFVSPFVDPNAKCSTHGVNYSELDGLRGIAVLIVLSSHTAAFGMYAQGSLGVLMFFFLSGFVLSLPFVDKPNKICDRELLGKYFLNRALRIIPAYWVACIIIFCIATVGVDWLLWNMSFIKGWNHFWSVAEEVRFYLLFPVVIALLALLPNKLLQIIALILLIYFSYEHRLSHKVDMLDGRHVAFYFWVFLGGVLTCFLQSMGFFNAFLRRNLLVKYILLTVSVLALLMLVFSANYYMDVFWKPNFAFIPSSLQLNGWRASEMWFCLFLILFLSATVYRESILNQFLSLWLFRHLGLLSYSIYLYHMNIMFILQKKGYTGEKLFLYVLILAYALAYCSYILIEKPALSAKKRFKLMAS